jgi:site-specific recombinase XerD
VSGACDLRWDDLDLPERSITTVRGLKGRDNSTHYLERDEVNGLRLLQRQQATNGTKSAYVFVNERGQPFGRMGIARMIERAGEAAGLPFPVHVHMLWHSTGYALAARGMDTDAFSTTWAMPASPTGCATRPCRRCRSRTFGVVADCTCGGGRLHGRLSDLFTESY